MIQREYGRCPDERTTPHRNNKTQKREESSSSGQEGQTGTEEGTPETRIKRKIDR